jgi:hypothetical protein
VNFLQICDRIHEELNGVPLGFTSVDLGESGGTLIVADPVRRQIIRAAQLAFDWVMDFSRHWEFLNQRGEIFDIEADVREYWKPWIESVQWDSLYLTKTGSTTRWPVYQMLYDAWQQQEQAEVPSEGYPFYLISAPSDRWVVWPTPSEDWTLNGNWQYKKSRMLVSADEPPWDERYHDLVVWRALLHLQHTQEDKGPSAAQRAFNSMWPGFLTEYLPKFRGAHALA